MAHYDVLVLDSTYRPCGSTDIYDAAWKLVSNKAFAFAGATIIATVGTLRGPIEVPSILVLKAYVPIPKSLSRHITNPLLFARDNFTCQYCGTHVSDLPMVRYIEKGKVKHRKMKLTRDHCKPQSKFKNKNDANTWENVTTACEKCNNIKGDQLPYECGMYPITTPKRPTGVLITVYDKLNREQQSFIDAYANGDISAFIVGLCQ